VHLSKWPEPILIDPQAELEGELIKEIISKIRNWKSENGMALNVPLTAVEIYGNANKMEMIKSGGDIIKSTLNIENLKIGIEMPTIEEVITNIKPDYSKIGPIFKERSGKIIEWVGAHGEEIVREIKEKGEFSIPNFPSIPKDFIKLEKEFLIEGKKIDLIKTGDVIVSIEIE
jgi:valyl-tRNA synthetase